jgi:hypothetical protein
LAGLSTIRAFNQQNIFVMKNALNIDINQKCYIPSINVNRWLAIRLELVGAVIIFISACLAVTALVTTGIDGGLVGLVLSYALSTTGALVRGFIPQVTQCADFATQELGGALCKRSRAEYCQRRENSALR